EGPGYRLRSAVLDRDDAAPQRRVDYGERVVRYGRRGPGRRNFRLCNGCGQWATGRNQNYAEHVGKEGSRGETMNRTSSLVFRFAVAAILFFGMSRTQVRAQEPAPAQPKQESAGQDGAKTDTAKADAVKKEDGEGDENPFAPKPAPPLPPGMTGSDPSDPRANLTPGLYDAG